MSITHDDVRKIIDTTATDAQIDALIAQAVLITAACASGWSTELTDAINIWVTAHLIVSGIDPNPGAIFEKLGDAETRWTPSNDGKSGGLYDTSFGRQALLLDPNGCLAKRGKDGTIFKVL